nr:uncharacterized protein LOC121130583 [Lepeophtheirus salmonis]
MDKLKKDIARFHFEDPQQSRSAFELTQRVLGNIGFQCLNSTSMDCAVQRAEHKIKVLKIVESALPYKSIYRINPVDLTYRFMSLKSTFNMFSSDPENMEDWNLINIDLKENYPGGSISFLKYIQKYLLYFMASANISDYDETPFFTPKYQRLNVTISTSDAAFMALKFPAPHTQPKTKDIPLNIYNEFDSNWRVPLNTWRQPFEKINIPWDESFKTQGKLCKYEAINILVGIYPWFGYIAPKRRNSVNIKAHNFTINSKVISVHMFRGNRSSSSEDKLCSLHQKAHMTNGVRIRFYHNHLYTSRRKILHHESELQSEVEKRKCVVWDEKIGKNGGWTSDESTTLITEQDSTLCEFHTYGTYAIIAEIVEPVVKPRYRIWLSILPNMGFFVSFLLVGLLIIIIVSQKFLWNMFHIVRLNTLISLLLTLLFAFLSQLDTIREDVHYNAGIGTCLVYFVCSLTAFLLMESIMYVAGITDGVIGGYTSSYVLFGWGIPMFPIGLTWYYYGVEIGTDPLCFMGWNNYTKYPFFIHIYTMLGISIILSVIILCNNSSPETRKDSMIDDLRSMSTGIVAMTYFVTVIWAFAYFTIIRHPREEMKDFYPIFWVFTSLLGVLAFAFLGLSSNQISDVLFGNFHSNRLRKFKRMTTKEMRLKKQRKNRKQRKRRLAIRKSRKVKGTREENKDHISDFGASTHNQNNSPRSVKEDPSKVDEKEEKNDYGEMGSKSPILEKEKGPPKKVNNTKRKKVEFSSESEDSMSIDEGSLESSELSSSSDVEMNYNKYMESSDSN